MQQQMTKTQTVAAASILASAFFSSPALAQFGVEQAKLPPIEPAVTTLHENVGVKIQSASEFVQKWSAAEPLYVKGQAIASPADLSELRQWIIDHNKNTGSHWTVVLIEKSAGYEYASGGRGAHFGANGYTTELKDRFVGSSAFNFLTDPKTGEHNGALLFVSLDNDGQNRRMILWTKEMYDHFGVGSGSDTFLKEIFPSATRLIRDEGKVTDATKLVIGSLDTALAHEQANGWHLTSGEKTALIIGGISVVVIVGIGLLCWSSRNSKGGSYGGSSSSSVFFFDGGGYSGGGYSGGDCGGGGGGDCGGGGSF